MAPILRTVLENFVLRKTEWSKPDGKVVLLTGAYGTLASYIVYFVLYLKTVKKVNVKLVAVVRNKNKFTSRFHGIQGAESIQVVQSDLSGPLYVDGQVDYIIHAASLASPQYYSVCPVDVLLPNTLGTYFLLELAREKKVKGFLLFSTCDIYGTPVPGSRLVDENSYGSMDPLDIHNCYSESKRMSETICKAFQVQYQVPAKIARIAHTYAPTMDIQNDPRVFSSFVKNIIAGEDIVMKSDGTGRRSFCYITDAVAGYFTILFDGKEGEAYNVCNTSQFISIRELAERLAALYPEKGLKVIRRERSKEEAYTENTLLTDCEQSPNNSKLEALGWKAEVGIEEGFRRVIEYIGADFKK